MGSCPAGASSTPSTTNPREPSTSSTSSPSASRSTPAPVDGNGATGSARDRGSTTQSISTQNRSGLAPRRPAGRAAGRQPRQLSLQARAPGPPPEVPRILCERSTVGTGSPTGHRAAHPRDRGTPWTAVGPRRLSHRGPRASLAVFLTCLMSDSPVRCPRHTAAGSGGSGRTGSQHSDAGVLRRARRGAARYRGPSTFDAVSGRASGRVRCRRWDVTRAS